MLVFWRTEGHCGWWVVGRKHGVVTLNHQRFPLSFLGSNQRPSLLRADQSDASIDWVRGCLTLVHTTHWTACSVTIGKISFKLSIKNLKNRTKMPISRSMLSLTDWYKKHCIQKQMPHNFFIWLLRLYFDHRMAQSAACPSPPESDSSYPLPRMVRPVQCTQGPDHN